MVLKQYTTVNVERLHTVGFLQDLQFLSLDFSLPSYDLPEIHAFHQARQIMSSNYQKKKRNVRNIVRNVISLCSKKSLSHKITNLEKIHMQKLTDRPTFPPACPFL